MDTSYSKQLVALADRLELTERDVALANAVIGFDAFVDESIRIVGERSTPESYQAMRTISDFGDWVSRSAGLSGSREFVCEETRAGGCSVNMGDGIATVGVPLTAFSGVGSPAHPAFQDFSDKCRAVHSVGMEPGRAIVTEFDDGKLMFCSFSHFARLTPEYLHQQFADGSFRAACEDAKGIAFTSWSVYPYMTDCWRYIYQEALAGITHRPHFFFDLADPASRSTSDVVEMIEALQGFEAIGPVTLSLNGNEANQVASALGFAKAGDEPNAVQQLAGQIREHAAISEASIHLVRGATSVSNDGVVTVDGPYCEKPQRSVGAGDRFNAGIFIGLLLGLSPADRLLLGCAGSGYYVRNAASAAWPALIQFLRRWGEHLEQPHSTELLI